MTKRFGLLVAGISIGLVAIVSVAYGISANMQPKVAQTAPNPPTVAELLTLVNAERAKNGVAPLKEDSRLDTSAQMKANDEVAYNYFGHISPHDKKHGYEYINLTGITCKTDSENLHYADLDILSAKETVDGWIQSPAHHKAMIDAKYTLTGFGIDGTQVVEHFCEQ